MKRLMIFTMLAVATAAAAGCNRGWSSWFSRGDRCETCDPCSSSPVYGEEMLLAPSATMPVLPPGPIEQLPPG